MAEETKHREQLLANERERSAELGGLDGGIDDLGQFENEDGQDDPSSGGGNNMRAPREGSIQEMIDKYQKFIDNPLSKDKGNKTADEDEDEEDTSDPNMKFVQSFDSFSSFMKAA